MKTLITLLILLVAAPVWGEIYEGYEVWCSEQPLVTFQEPPRQCWEYKVIQSSLIMNGAAILNWMAESENGGWEWIFSVDDLTQIFKRPKKCEK